MRGLNNIASLHYSSDSNSMATSAPSPASNTSQSPVPYLFGGLAAMLALIAFALLILACSYWRLSGRTGGDDTSDDNQGGDGKQADSDVRLPPNCFGEGFVVIMAGDEKPTFLATPTKSTASRGACASSFGENTADVELKVVGENVGVTRVSEQGSDQNL